MVRYPLKFLQSQQRKNQNDKKPAIFLEMCLGGNDMKHSYIKDLLKVHKNPCNNVLRKFCTLNLLKKPPKNKQTKRIKIQHNNARKMLPTGLNRISIVSGLAPKYLEWKAGRLFSRFPEAQIAYWFWLRSNV